MTNFEAISAELGLYAVPDSHICYFARKNELNPDADNTPQDDVNIAKAAISILRRLYVIASENNGGYELTYKDAKEINMMIHAIAKENGLTDIAEEFDTRSRITDISDQW